MTITFVAPDGVELSAQRFRQAHAALYGGGSGRRLGARSGFRVDTPSNILTATSTTWTLTPCSALIDPGATTHQGGYSWASDANETGTVTAADATYARKDIVYIQINDSTAGDGSGAVTAEVEYLAGTPASTPVAPTIPARSFLVGTINVPVSGGGSPTVTLNPARFAAAGGILPVYSATERDAIPDKYDGLTVRRNDLPTKPVQVWTADASKWLTTNGPGIIYVPIWSGVTDFGTGGALTGTYWVDGDRVHVRSRARFGSGGIMGTGAVFCPLPSGYPIAGVESTALGSGVHVTAGGQVRPLVVFTGSSTTASVWAPTIPVQTPGTASYTAGNGDYFEISITYQTSAV
jgi:hypothetical protein